MDAGLNVRRVYANYVLRPLTIVAAVCGIYFLFRRSWLTAGELLAAWVCVSVIGYDVVKPSPTGRAESGQDETYRVAKAVGKIAALFFILIAISMLIRGFRWYIAIPAAWLVGFSAAAIPVALVFYIVGYLQRRKLSR